MISISQYLENIYVDFAGNIDEGVNLCELKGLNFAAGCLPDYSNIQIQRLYLLRYTFAYGFEYTGIYSDAITMLNNPKKVSVASIGCGNFMDYWSLTQAINKKNIDCQVRYVGIDEIDWNYKFQKRDEDELLFRRGNAIDYFEQNKEFISDIYFFPKSISEFDSHEMSIIVNNLQNKPILKDKLIFCFSLRANQGSRERDLAKTEQIIDALKRNGFHLNNPSYVYTYYRENKGIITYQYLNRKPTTKTGNIFYRIIEMERN